MISLFIVWVYLGRIGRRLNNYKILTFSGFKTRPAIVATSKSLSMTKNKNGWLTEIWIGLGCVFELPPTMKHEKKQKIQKLFQLNSSNKYFEELHNLRFMWLICLVRMCTLIDCSTCFAYTPGSSVIGRKSARFGSNISQTPILKP